MEILNTNLEKITLRNGKVAFIGFDNFEQAKSMGETFLFSKRDGQDWIENGYVNKPLTSDDYLKDLGDNYSEVSLENEIVQV